MGELVTIPFPCSKCKKHPASIQGIQVVEGKIQGTGVYSCYHCSNVSPCPDAGCACAGRKRKPTFADGAWVTGTAPQWVAGTAPQQVLRSYWQTTTPTAEIAVLSGPHPEGHSGFYYVCHLEACPEPMPDPIGLPRKR